MIDWGQTNKVSKNNLLPLPESLQAKEILRRFSLCLDPDAAPSESLTSSIEKGAEAYSRVDISSADDSVRSVPISMSTSSTSSSSSPSESSTSISASSSPSELLPRRKLGRAFHRLIFAEFWFAGLMRLGNDLAVLVAPFLIKSIVAAASAGDFGLAILYALLITVNSIVQALLLQQFIHGCFVSGNTIVSASTSVCFHAMLALRPHRLDPPRTLGEINNVQAKDAASLREFVVFAHNLWSCPLLILICVVMLFSFLGWAGFVACIVLPVLLPLESWIASKAKAARKAVAVHSDARMAVINELIDGIRTVKLTNLCPLVYQKITDLREKELSVAWQGMLIEMVNTVLTRSSSLIVVLVTFAMHAAISGEPLTADRAFAALAAISIIGRPMQVLFSPLSPLSPFSVFGWVCFQTTQFSEHVYARFRSGHSEVRFSSQRCHRLL